jgi:hypothetical protein
MRQIALADIGGGQTSGTDGENPVPALLSPAYDMAGLVNSGRVG